MALDVWAEIIPATAFEVTANDDSRESRFLCRLRGEKDLQYRVKVIAKNISSKLELIKASIKIISRPLLAIVSTRLIC